MDATNRLGNPRTASVTVRIPKVMVAEAQGRAERAGVSLTQLIVTALARYLSAK